MRNILYSYWEIQELPIGDLPYSAIHRGLQDERYFRKFEPTSYREDFSHGHLSALLYWYPNYIELLYELAGEGKDIKLFFKRFPSGIAEGFEYLFPELKKKLDKISDNEIRLNHLQETKFKRTY